MYLRWDSNPHFIAPQAISSADWDTQISGKLHPTSDPACTGHQPDNVDDFILPRAGEIALR